MKNTVVIKKCEKYDFKEIMQKIEDGLSLIGGIDGFINKGERVLLKVNSLSDSPPETAVNTHPEFLRAVIRIVKKKTDKIFVGDSPAPPSSFSSAAKRNGLLNIIKEENVELYEFKENMEIESKAKLAYNKFKVDSLIKEVDKIINLPKFKTHTLTYLTLCVKNMFGLIPGIKKPEYHLKAGRDKETFAKMLVDLYFSREPDLNIVDGIKGVEGNGPGTGGIPVDIGVILIGVNGFLVDYIASKIAGFNPDEIRTISIYKKYIIKKSEIEVNLQGEPLKNVLKKLKPPASDLKSIIPDFLYDWVKNMATPKPVFIKEKCIGCLRCVNICPAKALNYKKEKGIICDYKKCIRCYVCHEICPEKAIDIKKTLLSNLFNK
jgi:uncharacterized protein (DUF362 family)/Pyruvate/2-oxoacid:ferredoxin oxidoreductase delta subunit